MNLLLLALATEISKMGDYTPSTDRMDYINTDYFKSIEGFKGNDVRNEILENILPVPIDFKLSNLLSFKDKYREDLNSFREEIELVVGMLANINDLEEKEIYKNKQVENLKKRINYIVAKMRESKLKQIFTSSWIGATVSTIGAIATDSVVPIGLGTTSLLLSSAKNLSKDKSKGHEMRYVGLLNKEL
jgi:hypothetical protein